MATNYFPWIADDDGQTASRSVKFDDGMTATDTVFGSKIRRQINTPYGVATSEFQDQFAAGGEPAPTMVAPPNPLNLPRTPVQALAVESISPAPPAAPTPPPLGEKAVNPSTEQATVPSEEIDISSVKLSPPKMADTRNWSEGVIDANSTSSLPSPSPYSDRTTSKIQQIEQTRGARAAAKYIDQHIDARPIPAWMNFNAADASGSVASNEPGVEQLWKKSKDGKIRFTLGDRSYQAKGRTPGELATNFRRLGVSFRKEGNQDALAATRKISALLFD